MLFTKSKTLCGAGTPFSFRYCHTRFFLFSSQTKNGPPNIAVIIPTGISVGAMMVLAIVSQIIKKLAPNSIDTGIRILRSEPTNSREIWGTINPTKPMGPVIATTVAVIKDAVIKPIF